MSTYEQTVADAPSAAEQGDFYALCTRSRHEKVADQALKEKGIESFLPLLNIRSQWKDRRKLVQKPLFPGYLFARVCREQLCLMGTIKGVAYVVGNGRGPIPVPNAQVHAVRHMVEAAYPVAVLPWLAIGRPVRVVCGPLAGVEAVIADTRDASRCRLIINVDLLGRCVAVEIDAGCVEPVL